ncbi:Nucleoside phosphorylase domain [Trinorchestia longiramus]|nr:Nucleoside phosphorylase domain [Trinorchestia longiramus]
MWHGCLPYRDKRTGICTPRYMLLWCWLLTLMYECVQWQLLTLMYECVQWQLLTLMYECVQGQLLTLMYKSIQWRYADTDVRFTDAFGNVGILRRRQQARARDMLGTSHTNTRLSRTEEKIFWKSPNALTTTAASIANGDYRVDLPRRSCLGVERTAFSMSAPMEERIVMTPKSKTATSTVLQVERRKVEQTEQERRDVHVGGGQHVGIVVNKTRASDDLEDTAPQLQLEFRVFLVSGKSGQHTHEQRHLRFWFAPHYGEQDQAKMAQEFFKELVAPLDFPRDYVGFIKKIMKMMQHAYKGISKVEVELRQLEDTEAPPQGPLEQAERELSEEQVLEVIESSYPNPITIHDITKRVSCPEEKKIRQFVKALEDKHLVKLMAPDCYTRVVLNETDVQVVGQIPTMVRSKQPTIAIITAHYSEKLAVDALISDQETFVRYTTVDSFYNKPLLSTCGDGWSTMLPSGNAYGESNVYTLGHIGNHRVVCTKLPQIGHDRSASIAAGSATTRLLGTFQKVEHVLLVGVAGGVPHYTDYIKHVRLGDVVVAAPSVPTSKNIYLYCESAKKKDDGGHQFDCRSWGPPDLTLQDIAAKLKNKYEGVNAPRAPWLEYLSQSEQSLADQEMCFQRPPDFTDRLFMSIGGSDVIQVTHPAPHEGQDHVRAPGVPRVHLGLIASGRCVVLDPRLHQDFASELGVLAFDQEMDAVIESVYGNRKDTYTVIRGIADYRDGSVNREWQPYAALAAAAFMKALICGIPLPL